MLLFDGRGKDTRPVLIGDAGLALPVGMALLLPVRRVHAVSYGISDRTLAQTARP